MPNWCENTLFVYGPEADVQRFKQDVKAVEVGDGGLAVPGASAGEYREIPLSFERHLPTPTDENGELTKGDNERGMPDWYNWRVENWGTKWDLDDSTTLDDLDPDYLRYSFDTAWSPPVEWLTFVAQQYPTLSFKLDYREPGMCFEGVLDVHKGDVQRNESWDMHDASWPDVREFDEAYGV
jgi:hypothetical protein